MIKPSDFLDAFDKTADIINLWTDFRRQEIIGSTKITKISTPCEGIFLNGLTLKTKWRMRIMRGKCLDIPIQRYSG